MALNQKNRDGINKAERLINEGKIINPNSWNPPEPNKENKFIKENGIKAYANWHMAIDTSENKENKGRYGMIYTSDFKNVDAQGLAAIAQRAGQIGMENLSDKASKLLDKIQNNKTNSMEKENKDKETPKFKIESEKNKQGVLNIKAKYTKEQKEE